MPRSRSQFCCIFILSIVLGGCIDFYTPKLTQSQRSVVIEGILSDQEGIHSIYVSRSMPYHSPINDPISGCYVQIFDETDESILMGETEPGQYDGLIPASFIQYGRGYRLEVRLPGGQIYRSGLETMPAPCPPIDSLYYQVDNLSEDEPGTVTSGLQFLVDMDAGDSPHEYFRWKVEETWKYYSRYIPEYLYQDEEIIEYPGDPFEHFICYKTLHIRELFTGSTKQLTRNRLKAHPLNFVSNSTDRLKIKYSLLVKQMAISEASYTYWEQIRSQTQDAGGFYETQPAQMRGNIYNVNDPAELVLGIFDVAAISERRIFVTGPFPFFFRDFGCELDTINGFADFEEVPTTWKYLVGLGEEDFSFPYGMADNFCFDCTLRGGSTEVPDFWE